VLAGQGDARHEPSGEPHHVAEAPRDASDINELLPLPVAAHEEETRRLQRAEAGRSTMGEFSTRTFTVSTATAVTAPRALVTNYVEGKLLSPSAFKSAALRTPFRIGRCLAPVAAERIRYSLGHRCCHPVEDQLANEGFARDELEGPGTVVVQLERDATGPRRVDVGRGDVNGQPCPGQAALALHVGSKAGRQGGLFQRERQTELSGRQSEDRAPAREPSGR
jgi:hypothetical protein